MNHSGLGDENLRMKSTVKEARTTVLLNINL